MRKDLQAKHPKANHIVWAYRKINEYDQIVEESSDIIPQEKRQKNFY